MSESPNDRNFIREKVVKPRTDWKRLIRRTLLIILGALAFGIIAAVTFVVAVPRIADYFPQETPAARPEVTIERDPEPLPTEGYDPDDDEPWDESEEDTWDESEEDMRDGSEKDTEEEPEETGEEPEPIVIIGIDPQDLAEAVEQSVNEYLDELSWSSDSLLDLYAALQEINRNADKSVVEISSVRLDTDFFDNPIKNTGDYAGIIVAINPREALILVPDSAVSEADELNVTFADGESAPGEIFESDSVAHIAIIRAYTADIPETTLNMIEAVELGNSYLVNAGDPVIAIGSPAGFIRSVSLGMISYIATGVQVADGQTRVFCMNDTFDADKGTFILNLSGELIGWTTDIFEDDTDPSRSMIMAISDYKGILEKLTNGTDAPYIGIIGQDVTDAMQEEGVPEGFYITESIAEGPAYRAGIQNGDIVTMIGDRKTTSIRDIQDYLEGTKVSDIVNVTVQRKGIDDYKEIEYEVTIGAR